MTVDLAKCLATLMFVSLSRYVGDSRARSVPRVGRPIDVAVAIRLLFIFSRVFGPKLGG
jgi:hypothetical protein